MDSNANAEPKRIYLDEDPIKLPGARYALLSFVSPTSSQKSDKLGMKIRGVFETQEEATAHVNRLMALDPDFDIFVADMHRWLLVPPSAEEMPSETYRDSFLDTLIKTEKSEKQRAREFFNQRKDELVKAAQDDIKTAGSSTSAEPGADEEKPATSSGQ